MERTVLCIAGALFGRPFLLEAKRLGWRVYLMTEEKYLREDWPRDHIDEIFAVPDLYDEKVVRNVVTYLARTTRFDRIVGLGEFDIEVAAALREYTRIRGMGETTARYFRDKLAMRMKARDDGIRIPEFVRILYHPDIAEFMQRVEPPWVLKPRMGASSAKVRKVYHPNEVWECLEQLGDKQSSYLLEQYIAGDVYHVDSIVWKYKPVFAVASRYGMPMLDLNTHGGTFTTRMIRRGSEEERMLKKMNAQIIKAFGLKQGITHIEYIRSRSDGQFYFLEAGARVGGARIPDVIWHATGICLWHEWARLELRDDDDYAPPKPEHFYGGAIFTLARQEWPDMSAYTDPEICWVQRKRHYAGLILRSSNPDRIEELLAHYYPRFVQDFMAHVPPETAKT